MGGGGLIVGFDQLLSSALLMVREFIPYPDEAEPVLPVPLFIRRPVEHKRKSFSLTVISWLFIVAGIFAIIEILQSLQNGKFFST